MDKRPRKTDRRVMDPLDRLRTFSERDEAGCLIFTGAKGSATEYPRVWVTGKKMAASRAHWTVVFGDPPGDRVVRHKCDVRNCIEIKHLELGTYAENTADMHARGRSNSKLDKDKAKEIRLLYEYGDSVENIASFYEVSRSTVYNVLNGKVWNE